jgi:hypothetical protein
MVGAESIVMSINIGKPSAARMCIIYHYDDSMKNDTVLAFRTTPNSEASLITFYLVFTTLRNKGSPATLS